MPDHSRGRAYGRPASQTKPRNDAYTGLLILSLVAQVAGMVFLALDYSRFPGSPPPKPTVAAAAPSSNPTPPVNQNPQNPNAPK
ncbi:MAG TPA: hypothetical protein VMS17_01150 [Gemmataceae bacterium]|nr:hypothetical protein [Gemmataceae bacterium]